MPRRVPLSSRPLDFLYFVFMLIHVPCTVLLDAQALYPRRLVPKVLLDVSEWYIALSGDPLIRGAFHGGPEFDWFRAFLYLELIFQLPVFLIAIKAFYAGPPKLQTLYPLILAYSASSCTTTFACLVYFLTSPDPTPFQMLLLMVGYVPFFLVPFGMAVDMVVRLTKAQQIKALKTE